MQFFLTSLWEDKRLNSTSISKLANKKLLIPDDAFGCFWSPSIIFDNDKDEKLYRQTLVNTIMAVYENKTVVRSSR